MNSKYEEDYDFLKICNNASIKKRFALDEKILLSTTVEKINKRSKRQERTLLVTNKALYNIDSEGLLSWLASPIKRKIEIIKIHGVTVNDQGHEFVIHVPSEYDYHYSSKNKRNLIIQMIAKSFYGSVRNRGLVFYFKTTADLSAFSTTDNDKSNGISRIPKEGGLELSEEKILSALTTRSPKKEELKVKSDDITTVKQPQKRVSIEDFLIFKLVGENPLSKTVLARKYDNRQLYLIKLFSKDDIIGREMTQYVKTERTVLATNKTPFINQLEYAFQTQQKIFLVTKYLKGGNLFDHLTVSKRFDEERAKFYAAEITLALEFLHGIDVLHRDVKPESVLMDEEGHVALSEFGNAKLVKDGKNTNSFLGTPEYLAPEMTEEVGHSKPVDWWGLGILIYEMVIGIPPFYNKEQNYDLMFAHIREKEVNFGTKIKLSDEAKDIVKSLLVKDPQQRLGSKGAQEVKNHPWFANINWSDLAQRRVSPPFKPESFEDFQEDKPISYEEPAVVQSGSFVRSLSSLNGEFEGFSYPPERK